MRDGLRAVSLGTLALVGLFLGWRKAPDSRDNAACAIDLPCKICSRLPGCEKPEADDARKLARTSRQEPGSKIGGME